MPKASNGKRILEVGERATYTRGGDSWECTVLKVHYDDHPPYYTVRLDTGAERQTPRDRLMTAEEQSTVSAAPSRNQQPLPSLPAPAPAAAVVPSSTPTTASPSSARIATADHDKTDSDSETESENMSGDENVNEKTQASPAPPTTAPASGTSRSRGSPRVPTERVGRSDARDADARGGRRERESVRTSENSDRTRRSPATDRGRDRGRGDEWRRDSDGWFRGWPGWARQRSRSPRSGYLFQPRTRQRSRSRSRSRSPRPVQRDRYDQVRD